MHASLYLRMDLTHTIAMGLFNRKSKKEIPEILSSPVYIEASFHNASSEYVYVPPADNRKAECPSCNGQLKKVPGSKSKCPLCGEYMYVRTNPHTRERLVVTEVQAEEIDDEIAKLNGTYEIRLAEKMRREKIKADLTKSFKGKVPSEKDIEWRILNQDSLKYARARDWISYMLTRSQMAERQLSSGHPKDALRIFLEVASLAVNGANDGGSAIGIDAALVHELGIVEFKPGDVSSLTFIHADGIRKAAKDLNLDMEGLTNAFLAEYQSRRLAKLPLGATDAWVSLETYLAKQFGG